MMLVAVLVIAGVERDTALELDVQPDLGRALGRDEDALRGLDPPCHLHRDRPTLMALGQELGEAVEARRPRPRLLLAGPGGAVTLLRLSGLGAAAVASTTGATSARQLAATPRFCGLLDAILAAQEAAAHHATPSVVNCPAEDLNYFQELVDGFFVFEIIMLTYALY